VSDNKKETKKEKIKIDDLLQVTGGSSNYNGMPPTVPENKLDKDIQNNI